MSINLIAEVWQALKIEIGEGNIPDAAESLINILIDNDFEASDIKEAFRGETEIMDALREYVSNFEDEEYEEEDEEEWD